jgi:lysozyme
MAVLLGLDLSHYQGRPNLTAFRVAGGTFVIAKATQGVTYVDPEFATTRADAAAAGLVFGSYHFSNWGNPVAEANYYLQHAQPKPGELIAFDAEGTVPAGVDVVAFADAWSRTVKAALGCPPLIYMNKSWLTGHNWAPVLADGDGLWLASYDGTVQSPGGIWPAISFKQYTDKGVEPGVPGPVDVDEFFGDLAALQKYTVPNGGTTVALTPVEAQLVANTLLDTPVALQGVDDDGKPRVGNISLRIVLSWFDNNFTSVRGLVRQVLAAQAAQTGAVIDQAAADKLTATLLASPEFQASIAKIGTSVVEQLDADLAARFGNK